MKINLRKRYDKYWRYNRKERNYKQEEFDYVFKYLDFDKLDKDWFIHFNNAKTEKWFRKTYINSDLLAKIYKKSPLGYEYLKDNWGKGIFYLYIYYSDKQELKTIVNKIINVEFDFYRRK